MELNGETITLLGVLYVTITGGTEILKATVTKITTPKDDGETPRRKTDEEIIHKITDLHDWHNKEDEDGVKLWYLPNWLRRMFEEMHKVQSEQVAVMQKISETQTVTMNKTMEMARQTTESNKKLIELLDEIKKEMKNG